MTLNGAALPNEIESGIEETSIPASAVIKKFESESMSAAASQTNVSAAAAVETEIAAGKDMKKNGKLFISIKYFFRLVIIIFLE